MTAKLKQLGQMILNIPPHVLTLKLTVIFLLLHDYSNEDLRGLSILIVLIGAVMLLHEKLLFSRVLWISYFAIMAAVIICFVSSMDNHKYLIAYWALACGLAIGTDRAQYVMRENARNLIGLAFLFALAWKILGGEYLDGSFFRGIMLIDDRFWLFTKSITHISAEALESFDDLLAYFEIFPSEVSHLAFVPTAALQPYAIGMSGWTLFIEGVIAVSFLLRREFFFTNLRNWFLVLFLATTYVLAPVSGFAIILCIMGLAQVPDHQRNWRLSYVFTFFILQLWEFVPDVKDYLLSA